MMSSSRPATTDWCWPTISSGSGVGVLVLEERMEGGEGLSTDERRCLLLERHIRKDLEQFRTDYSLQESLIRAVGSRQGG